MYFFSFKPYEKYDTLLQKGTYDTLCPFPTTYSPPNNEHIHVRETWHPLNERKKVKQAHLQHKSVNDTRKKFKCTNGNYWKVSQ